MKAAAQVLEQGADKLVGITDSETRSMPVQIGDCALQLLGGFLTKARQAGHSATGQSFLRIGQGADVQSLMQRARAWVRRLPAL